LQHHVPDVRIDVIVAHDGAGPVGGGHGLAPDRDALAARVGEVVLTDLFDGRDGHDPALLARPLGALLRT
jgi:hypothetical protein